MTNENIMIVIGIISLVILIAAEVCMMATKKKSIAWASFGVAMLCLAFLFYGTIVYNPDSAKEVLVCQKQIVTINEKEDCYDYIIYYIYNNDLYSTRVSGKEYYELKADNISSFTITSEEWKHSIKKTDNVPYVNTNTNDAAAKS